MGPPYPGPWRTKHFPWIRAPLDDTNVSIDVMKGAQVAFTEWALNRALHAIDIKGWDVLYVLPSQNPDAKDFSARRFDGAVSLSPHLENLFSDTKNIGLKRAGSRAVYIRGSRSKSQLKSIPVNLIILDELEEMSKENIRLVEERQAGQREKVRLTLSTPRAHGSGIHERYMRTDQKEFFFPCPSCKRHITLEWGDGPGHANCSFVRTGESFEDPNLAKSHFICTSCKAILPHADANGDSLKYTYLGAGFWVAKYPDRLLSGYAINQLYSSTVKPVELAQKSLLAEIDIVEAQEFYNSSIGIPHEPKDGRVTDEHLNACILAGGGYTFPQAAKSASVVTMGIDVGFPQCHYVVEEWIQRGQAFRQETAVGRLLDCGTVRSFDDLHARIASFRPNKIVIDAQPERRLSLQFAHQYPGRAFTCFYNDSHKGKQISKPKNDEEAAFDDPIISVDRTSWLDLALGRLKVKTMLLPSNSSPHMVDYRNHCKALVRMPERAHDGSKTFRYKETGPDHFGHARTYSEVALALTYGAGPTQNIV